jgi:hypothetical protein
MSTIVIVILKYHHHKPVDLISITFTKHQKRRDICRRSRANYAALYVLARYEHTRLPPAGLSTKKRPLQFFHKNSKSESYPYNKHCRAVGL